MEYESDVVLQSGENDKHTEKEIKEESVWLERGYATVKDETEELYLQHERNTSDFAVESNCSTVSFNSYDEAYSNIEVKEEQWWEEAQSVEVKPESEELIIPEIELPVDLKASIAGKNVEENAAIENIASSSRSSELFQINRNKYLLGKRSQINDAKMYANCECKLHCFGRINDVERKRIMEHFQKLRYANLQNAYFFNCLKLDDLNLKKEETDLPSGHGSSLQYFVQTTKGDMVKVCKTAFLNIHGLDNNTELIENIPILLKKANLKSSFQNFSITSQRDPTSLSNLQAAVRMRNSILLFKKRKPFLKVSRPLTWKKKRALAILLLHRLQTQLPLGGM